MPDNDTCSMGGNVPLKVIHQGNESVIADDTKALIGSDPSSTIRIVRPGISRRHVVVSYDGSGWKVEDAGSRNGTFRDGRRVQVTVLDGPTTLYLGHPSDGEALSLVPVPATADATPAAPAAKNEASRSQASGAATPKAPAPVAPAAAATAATVAASAAADDDEAFDLPEVVPPVAVERTTATGSRARAERSATPTRVQPTAGSSTDVELAALTAAIRDQISAIKGLTWSVWAMIAATAALIVLTLFVGILSN